MKRIFVALAALGVFAVLLTGCGGEPKSTTPVAQQNETAKKSMSSGVSPEIQQKMDASAKAGGAR